MNYIDCYSITSSTTSTTSSICLPENRIKFSKDQITVGGNSFRSASDALLVYLQQYDVSTGKEVKFNGQDSGNKECNSLQLDQYLASNNQNISAKSLTVKEFALGRSSCNVSDAKEDVETLLTSQLSSSHLRENVPDTLREVRLQHLLKQAALKPKNQAKTELQQEVEVALFRSAQLLEKVTKEDISSTRALSNNINHVQRKVLGNDLVSSQDIPERREKQSGHTYSYRTSRPQRSPSNHSLSVSLHAPVSYQKQSRGLRRSASTDNLLPASHKLPPKGRWSLKSTSASLLNKSDPSDVCKSVRSRSESPGLKNPIRLDASGWAPQHDQCVSKSVPSWVGELSPSEVSNSLWNSEFVLEDDNDRKTNTEPHWVGMMENSIHGEDSLYLYEPKAPIPRTSILPTTTESTDKYPITDDVLDNNSAITTDSRSGLNISDLAISSAISPSNNKQVNAINSITKENYSVKYPPKLSVPNQANHTLTYSEIVTRPQHSRMLDSVYTGEAFLHNNILPQTAKLKKSMDNFVASSANLRHKSLSSDVSIASSGLQCSSIDTLSLLTGKPLLRKDVMAVNGIPRDDTVGNPNINPQDRSSSPTSNSQDQCSTDGLDGDRTWERMAGTFKPPVPVDSKDIHERNGISTEKNFERTLSGRKQPGSMETLKNMLFKLQAEESSTQEENSKNEEVSSKNCSKSYTDMIPALQNYDFKQEPGGQSLEKALVHLNRLKKLVQRTAPGSVDETVKTSLTIELSNENVEQEEC